MDVITFMIASVIRGLEPWCTNWHGDALTFFRFESVRYLILREDRVLGAFWRACTTLNAIVEANEVLLPPSEITFGAAGDRLDRLPGGRLPAE